MFTYMLGWTFGWVGWIIVVVVVVVKEVEELLFMVVTE
jgi:hypothetical protein